MILVLSLFAAAAAQPHLWQDPGAVEQIDFSRPAGGLNCPTGPFTFVEETFSGMSAKVLVRDASGVVWQVKGGPEARADAFSTRFVSALGYYAETICFIRQGRIDSLTVKLRRAGGFIQPDGTFTWASFERRDPNLRFLPYVQWTWSKNPFEGSSQLRGLAIVAMLLSNWDNKDARNTWQGPNTGVLETKTDPPTRIYFVTDWGQTLGSWKGLLVGKPWDVSAFEKQTPGFVRAVRNGYVEFGYRGQQPDFAAGLKTEHVRWLMQYLGRITDAQIRIGLLAAGATADEEARFAVALRARIQQLQDACR